MRKFVGVSLGLFQTFLFPFSNYILFFFFSNSTGGYSKENARRSKIFVLENFLCQFYLTLIIQCYFGKNYFDIYQSHHVHILVTNFAVK